MKLRALLAMMVVVGAVVGTVGISGAAPRAHAAYTQVCQSNDTQPASKINPLGTANFTGTNPLAGAHLFVESPWLYGGEAADAIANEVGLSNLTKQVSGTPIPWAQFRAQVDALPLSAAVRYRVTQLEKIADYPQAHRFTHDTAGGSGDAIYTQVQYYLCRMQRTDPTAAGVLTTYYLNHNGCATGQSPKFKEEVDATKAAIGNFPVLIFIEMDGVDATCWTNPALVTEHQQLIKYEVDQFSQLPHALLYMEGGASDANTLGEAVMMLKHEDANLTRGFFLNDTHFSWTYKEIVFGNNIAKAMGGLHFVIDTRANGNGPKVHPPPGYEVLCNPSGRGIGPPPGANNGSAYGAYSQYLDGFVWTSTPGDSGGKHCPGDPNTYAPGFDENLAIGEASRANNRIGPTPPYPSRPW